MTLGDERYFALTSSDLFNGIITYAEGCGNDTRKGVLFQALFEKHSSPIKQIRNGLETTMNVLSPRRYYSTNASKELQWDPVLLDMIDEFKKKSEHRDMSGITMVAAPHTPTSATFLAKVKELSSPCIVLLTY